MGDTNVSRLDATRAGGRALGRTDRELLAECLELTLDAGRMVSWELDHHGQLTWHGSLAGTLVDGPLWPASALDPIDEEHPRPTGEPFGIEALGEWLVAPIAVAARAGAPWGEYALEQKMAEADGTVRHFLVRARPVTRASRSVGFVGVVADVSEARTAEQALRELVDRYRLLIDLSPDGIVVHQEGIVTYFNPAAMRFVGISHPTEGLGKPITQFIHPDSLGDTIERIARLTEDGDVSEPAEATLVRADGSPLIIESVSVRTKWEGRTAYQVIMRDLTERKRNQEVLEHLALHDSLTGLPNRTLLLDRLASALARSNRTGKTTALIFMDLDQFKVINDSLGHAVGDRLLEGVAKRLTKSVRREDTVARFGGDEFLVICENVNRENALGIVVQLERALAEPFSIDGRDIYLTASMGIALAADGINPHELLRDADTAMFEAKDHGRARWELFDEQMRTRALERLEVERGLHSAISPDGSRSDQLELYYQPILSIERGAIVGAEALLRWNCPERGTLAPGSFISAAEHSRLIIPIGRWVVDEARRQVQRWRDGGVIGDDFSMSVNVSAVQLTDRVLLTKVAQLSRILGRPHDLMVEITESAYQDQHGSAVAFIDFIRSLGVRVALDDFGTGFSSVTRLRQYGVDCIKIDRSFVSSLETSYDDRKIVEALVTMARILGVYVVAEGVETQDQLDMLRDLGCTYAQGYHIARPLPADRFTALLTGSRDAVVG